MTSKTFLPELRETYRWVLKKNRGVLILFSILTFLAGPLILLLVAPGWVESYGTQAERLVQIQKGTENFMSYAAAAGMVEVLVFSAVLCVMLFGYMHNKRSVDLFHSLPVRREALLLGRWMAGLTVLFAPMLLNFVILWAVPACYGAPIDGRLVFYPFLWIVLMGTAAFTSCMLMAVCSGTMLDTALSVIGVNAGYPLLILCAILVINNLLPGASVDYGDHASALSALAPFAAWAIPILKVGSRPAWFLPWWIFLTLVMLAGSVLIYNRRKSESAENSLAFPLPKILIRFLLTAVGGLGFGLILNTAGGTANFFIGLIAGSLIAHTVVECIYSRGFRHLKKSFRWYGVFAAAFLVFYGIVSTGAFGYDTRLPDADSVESVVVDEDWYSDGFDGGSGCNVLYDQNGQYMKVLRPVLTEKESIRAVLQAQHKLVSLRRADGFPYRMRRYSNGGTLTVRYQLKDGRSITRSYTRYYDFDRNSNDEVFQAIVGEITHRKEYSEGLDMIFLLEPSDLKSVDLQNADGSTRKTAVPDDAQKQALSAALQNDLLNRKINSVPENTGSESASNPQGNALLSVHIDFQSNITPKDKRLQTLLGSYKGKINLNGGGLYNIYSADSEVYALLRQYGWL